MKRVIELNHETGYRAETWNRAMKQNIKWFIILRNHKIKYFILQFRERYVRVNLSDSFKLYRCSFSVFRHFAMSFRTEKIEDVEGCL